jgi:transcriptional regulator with XRE-family HTH domain
MDWKPAVEAIKARAIALRLPISKLCEEASLSGNSFWRWENGHNEPTLSVIGRLEDTLDRLESAKRERAA